MPEHAESEANKLLKQKFHFEKYGFYNATTYKDGNVGFSFKKNLREDDVDHVSLFHLFISSKTYEDTSIPRKPLIVTAVYGKKSEGGGVTYRHFTPSILHEPVDLDFNNEYFYDPRTNTIYKEDKEISGDDFLEEVYWKHIKPTKFVRGFLLRFRLYLWRVWLPELFSLASTFFHYLLLLISGDRYTYEYILQQETLNGEITSSRFERRVGMNRDNSKPEEKDKEAKKIDFFGITVPQWPIVFYSTLHLGLWGVLKHFGYITQEVEKFFENNFLIVLYVVVSFWLVETVLPYILKKSIKFSSTLSALCSSKRVSV